MEINISSFFINFLREKNCYESFASNLPLHLPLTKYLESYNLKFISGIIENSFSWKTTKEKFNYWYELDKEWKITINKYVLLFFIHILKKRNMYGNFINNTHYSITKANAIKHTQFIHFPYYAFYGTDIYASMEYHKLLLEWNNVINSLK